MTVGAIGRRKATLTGVARLVRASPCAPEGHGLRSPVRAREGDADQRLSLPLLSSHSTINENHILTGFLKIKEIKLWPPHL